MQGGGGRAAVRTAARRGLSVITKFRSTWAGLNLPGLAGVVWLCRSCHFRRHPSRWRTSWDALLDRLRGS